MNPEGLATEHLDMSCMVFQKVLRWFQRSKLALYAPYAAPSFKTINLLLSHHSLEAAKCCLLLHSNQSIKIPRSLLQVAPYYTHTLSLAYIPYQTGGLSDKVTRLMAGIA